MLKLLETSVRESEAAAHHQGSAFVSFINKKLD